MSKKFSQFTAQDTVSDNDYINITGATNRRIVWPDFLDNIYDRIVTPFIYPTIVALQEAPLRADEDDPVYVRVEETGYSLYKITNVAPSVGDIALDNGNTASLQSEAKEFLVDVVADISSLNFKDGSSLSTKGCLSIGDGGHGTFIVTDVEPDVVDGYSAILMDNGNWAVLQPKNGVILPEQFGAVGDGVADDTVAMQRSINSNISNTIVSMGTYLISGILVGRSNLTLTGRGTWKGAPNPVYAGFSHHPLIHFINKSNVRIYQLTFDISGWVNPPIGVPGNWSYRCVVFRQLSNDFKVKNCKFITTGGGPAAIGCTNYSFDNNELYCSGDGITYYADGVIDNWGEWNQGPQNFTNNKNKIYGAGVCYWGVLVNGEVFEEQLMAPKNIQIQNNQIFNCFRDSIWIGGRKPGASQIVISGNILDGGRKAISLSDCEYATVSNNVISNFQTHSIEGWKEGPGSTSPEREGIIGLRNSKIFNNILKDVALSLSGQPSAIWVHDNSEFNEIYANRIAGADHYWGITLSDTAANNKVYANSIQQGRSSRFNIIASANQVDGAGFTPTRTAVTNVSSSAQLMYVYKFGQQDVTVFFRIQVTPTAAAFTELHLSLPPGVGTIAADTVAGSMASSNGVNGTIAGDAANQRVRLIFTAISTSVHTFSGSFLIRN